MKSRRSKSRRGGKPSHSSSRDDVASLVRTALQRIADQKPAEAVALLEPAAERWPDDATVLEGLAAAYHQNDQCLSALKIFNRLISGNLATAVTWSRAGACLKDVGEYAQAISAFECGLKLDPRNAEMHNNLAQVCYRMGQVDRAAQHLETAIEESDAAVPWTNLAMLVPAVSAAGHRRVLDVRRAYARRLAAEQGAISERARTDFPRRERMRIGYVSSFFDNANYMKPVWGLINQHDRAHFEISLFSDTPVLKGMPGYRADPSDHVHETGALTNSELAELVRRTQIDILVDLNAFSTPARLPLFLQPSAAVTAAWFNMYATSGLPAFDYIVGDEEVVRPEEEEFYSENVLRLPVSYLTFEVTHPTPPVAPPPCVRNGHLAFGSLVSQYKIAPGVLDAWSEILQRAEGTTLFLANRTLKSPQNREFVVEQFARRGVAAERLRLHGPAEHLEYLRYYDRIDVALDAFPYNGGTTTMEAIWQGVPVVTFEGDRWASRTSQTLLRRCHLGEFVAHDVAGMVQLAVDLAADPETPRKLSELRRDMRERLTSSSACDTAALARGMEDLYRAIRSRHRSGPAN